LADWRSLTLCATTGFIKLLRTSVGSSVWKKIWLLYINIFIYYPLFLPRYILPECVLDGWAVPHCADKAALVPNEESKHILQVGIHIPILSRQPSKARASGTDAKQALLTLKIIVICSLN